MTSLTLAPLPPPPRRAPPERLAQQRPEELLRLAQRLPLLPAQPLVPLRDGGEALLEGQRGKEESRADSR